MADNIYALIYPDEDGWVHFLDKYDFDDNGDPNITDIMEGRDIIRWVERYDLDERKWDEGDAMFVKITCVNPIPKEKTTVWELPKKD